VNDDENQESAGGDGAENAPRPKRKRQPKPVGAHRRIARELALQLLFEADVSGHPADEILARVRATQDPPPETFDYLSRLVRGYLANREEIDALIARSAPQFPIDQLATVDRNVLRIAVVELTTHTDVPAKSAINEAVELAKQFGGDNSGRFVNGVLGGIMNKLKPSENGARRNAE
jgi:N utilization substance protein B